MAQVGPSKSLRRDRLLQSFRQKEMWNVDQGASREAGGEMQVSSYFTQGSKQQKKGRKTLWWCVTLTPALAEKDSSP